jgi:hypothetical protein
MGKILETQFAKVVMKTENVSNPPFVKGIELEIKIFPIKTTSGLASFNIGFSLTYI